MEWFLSSPGRGIPLVVGAVITVVILFVIVYANRYVKVGPNTVLVISGKRRNIRAEDGTVQSVGFRIRVGGGAFVWPVLERVDTLSLEIMTLEVRTPEVYTMQGVPIVVDGIAQIKVRGDDVSIRTAAEQFLGKNQTEIAQIALQTVEGHLRAILGTMSVEEVYRNREAFAARVQEVAATDLVNMGLTIVSFTIRDIRDSHGYLEALGKPRIAQVKRDAVIGEAEAARDATIKSAVANQEGQQAKYGADSKIAEAQRDYAINVAEYKAASSQKQAGADLAYDLQKFKTEQLVRAEEVQVQVIEKEKQIDVQAREVDRRTKELTATVEKPAAAERCRIQTLAEAEQFRLRATAAGQADATRAVGLADADANKAKGLAQADIIKAQGFSEAEAMSKKADAWREYNEAAIAQTFIEKLPQIAAAVSAPLAKTERIVVVSTGGDSAGADKVTRDVVKIIAQLPPVLEAMTGMKLEDILARLPHLGEQAAPASAAGQTGPLSQENKGETGAK
ncbi:MAG TPA: SPFH domain-containing protein [Armatimonadota bacterium]|nr:SPFH domain-containing protein [Armatimonadota bacterium]